MYWHCDSANAQHRDVSVGAYPTKAPKTGRPVKDPHQTLLGLTYAL